MLCNLCPRNCNTDRDTSVGYCKMTNTVKISRAALHHWEEPCISAENGSGTVFFSGCNMGCVYCQNQDISHGGFGKEISVERLAQIFVELQNKNAHNINLVTPTHYTPQIIKAVEMAREKGLSLPVVYNTSGYEKAENIESLNGTVDVYLPDFKYFSADTAKKYSFCADYPQRAKEAISAMVKQTGSCVFDDDGVIQKGTVVRVLVLPGLAQEAKSIIEYLYSTYGDDIFISIMSQYTPCTNLEKYPEINRKLTQQEYDDVVDFAVELGLENGFVQEGEAASESFIPPFNLEGV
ncbi:MAG: radical SAM protein [Oscillospiraceae bacterium]|nr:radical SAM protein [Oscillospiraceae bacterium]